MERRTSFAAASNGGYWSLECGGTRYWLQMWATPMGGIQWRATNIGAMGCIGVSWYLFSAGFSAYMLHFACCLSRPPWRPKLLQSGTRSSFQGNHDRGLDHRGPRPPPAWFRGQTEPATRANLCDITSNSTKPIFCILQCVFSGGFFALRPGDVFVCGLHS